MQVILPRRKIINLNLAKGFDGVQSEKILYKNNEKLILAVNILALLQIIPFILQLLLVLVNMTKYNTLQEESDVTDLT